jgi:PAS domain S-box-containing protein
MPLGEIVKTVERNGKWDGDLQVRTRDGRELLVEARFAARRNPDTNETELLEAITDVTALRQSEQRFRALTIAASEVLYSMSPDWTVMRELHGGGFLADHISSNDWLNDYIPSDEQPRVTAAIEEAIRTKGVFELEHRVWLGDGTIGWASSRAVPLFDAKGRIREWFGAASDITARKRAEDALGAKEAELRQSQRLEAIGQLCAGVAHDFNNLLQGVISHLELVDDDDVPPGTREKVGVAIRLAEQGGSLAQQLLSFGRKQLLLPQEIEVPKLLVDFSHMLSRTLDPRIKVELSVAPDLGTVWADPTHLRSALLNLAINARDAMPSGGNLRLEADYANSSKDTLVFRIADTGTGIAQDDLNKVCEPFFSTKGLNGTGLGLSMVHGFAKQSGGDLHISSELGKGTRVQLSLPVQRDQQKVAA